MVPAVGCLPRCEGAGTTVAPSPGHRRLVQDELPHRDGATSTVHPLFQGCILPHTTRTEEEGPATAVALGRTTLRGKTTDAHQWLVETTLEEE